MYKKHLNTRCCRFVPALLCSALALPSAWAQETATSASETEQSDEVVELSPFEVQSSANDIGYYAENTLAGSRLNTNISDLAASITVVTKQQMIDTASIDLNDVFLYESNTEGVGNYTNFAIDKNGGVQDYIAGISNGGSASGPSTSNRVRGIGAIDTSRNYYPTDSRIPFDAYNTSTFEINRGPNSILFGLGSAAGIVNQTTAQAGLEKASYQGEVRVGSWGAFRAAAAFNRPLTEKSAFYVAILHDEKGYARKPSYDITNRQYGAVTFKPFSKTTLRANFENYTNRNQRPNSVTPRDLVTPWREAGSPAWNPLTYSYTVNGATSDPVTSDSDLPVGLVADSYGNPAMYVETDGTIAQYMQRRLGYLTAVSGSSYPGVGTGNTYVRTTTSGGYYQKYSSTNPLYVQKGVTSKSVYDYETVNLIAPNIGDDDVQMYNFEIEQEVIKNLYVQLGWYREDYEARNSYYISQQTGATVQIDTNLYNLDGTPNSFFGRPYVEIREPDDFWQWNDNNVLRATATYSFDFSKNDGWSKWLGLHRLMGLASDRKIESGVNRYREVITSDHDWQNSANKESGRAGSVYYRLYVGGADGSVSSPAPAVYNGTRTVALRNALYTGSGTTTADYNNYENYTWTDEDVTLSRVLHYVSSRSEQQTKSLALASQSYLWNDKIVMTLGWRKDENKARSTSNCTIDSTTGLTDTTNRSIFGDWQEVEGDTTSAGVVYHVTDWMSVHYNQSENFTPAGVTYNMYGEFLPLPTGEGKDYGVDFTLFDRKLYLNLNWYETKQLDSRYSTAGTYMWRMGRLDETVFKDWAGMVAEAEGLTSGTTAYTDRVLEITQLPANFTDYCSNLSGSSDVTSKGMEASLVFNPSPSWNIKFTGGRQETIYDNICPEYDEWVADRMEVWTSAHSDLLAEETQDFWTATGLTNAVTGASTTPQTWFTNNVSSLMTLQKKLEGKPTPLQREWRWAVISNYMFSNGPLKGFSLGGSVRWEDKGAIGFYAATADSDGVVRQLDPTRPIYDSSQTYYDCWFSYRSRLPWFNEKIRAKIQLNVRNLFESGGLQPIQANPDGQAVAFRIIDPRQVFLTTTFDF